MLIVYHNCSTDFISSCERELPFFCEIPPGPIRQFPPADPNLVPDNLDWNKCLNDPIWEHFNYTQASERLGSQSKETKLGTWNFLVEIHRTQSWIDIKFQVISSNFKKF